jgi:hypothetical protein
MPLTINPMMNNRPEILLIDILFMRFLQECIFLMSAAVKLLHLLELRLQRDLNMQALFQANLNRAL